MLTKRVFVIRKDGKNENKFKIMKLILYKNGGLKKAKTVKRNLTETEALIMKNKLIDG